MEQYLGDPTIPYPGPEGETGMFIEVVDIYIFYHHSLAIGELWAEIFVVGRRHIFTSIMLFTQV